MDDSQFVLADSNLEYSNIIENDKISTIVNDTFKEIATLLEGHCGPFSKFAMITRAGMQIREPVFSKDGIGIVNSIKYASPIKEIVRENMAYMGRRVERAGGDGTTTSMMILAKGIAKMREYFIDHKAPHIFDSIITYADLQEAYNKFSDAIIEKLNVMAVDVFKFEQQENFSDIIYSVAFSQAWTSSHGNYELSRWVAALFTTAPVGAWDYLSIERAKIENNTRYSIEKDFSQYTLDEVSVWPDRAKTDNNGVSRIRNDEFTIISSNAPGDGTDEGEQLKAKILEGVRQGDSFTVICPRTIPNMTQNELSEAFRSNAESDICLILVDADDSHINDILCLKALIESRRAVDECSLDYEYSSGTLRITRGLYNAPETSVLNPNFGNKDFPILNSFVENIDADIANLKRSNIKDYSSDIKRLNKIRMKLTIQNRIYFLIGGGSYDNVSSIDVVADAVIATKRILQHGFVLGGNKSLYGALRMYMNDLNNEHNSEAATIKAYRNYKINCICYCIADSFCRCIADIHLAMIHQAYGKEKVSFDSETFEEYLSTSVDLTGFNPESAFKMNMENNSTTLQELCKVERGHLCKVPLIMEPKDTDIELIKRFGELALKYIYTNRIIIENAMSKGN